LFAVEEQQNPYYNLGTLWLNELMS